MSWNWNSSYTVYERPNHNFVTLNTLRERGDFCDVTVKVGNRNFRAHRLVLAATTNYFYSMFTADFEERTKNVVTIENVSETNMQAIIKFSYTGKIVFTKENAVSLLKDADFFELTDVKDNCMKYLESNLEITNVCELSHLANLLPGCNFLLQSSKTFILENLRDVILLDDYVNIDFELLKSILSKDNSKISPELTLEAIIRWTSDNVIGKKTPLLELLRCVDIPNLKADSLYYYLIKNKLKGVSAPKHSEFIAEVLSGFKKNLGNNSKTSKSYIFVNDLSGATEIYDFTAEEWRASTPGVPKFYGQELQVVALKDKLCQITPSASSDELIFHAYNFVDKVWTNTKMNTSLILSPDILYYSMASLNDYVYMCGGHEYTRSGLDVETKKSVWRFSFETHTGRPINRMKEPRSQCQVVVLQGQIYAIGGKIVRGTVFEKLQPLPVNTMERYDPETDQWQTICSLDFHESDIYVSYGAVGLNGKIYLCGGKINGKTVASVKAYDLKTEKWTDMENMNTARRNHLVVELAGKIWAIGGYDEDGQKLASVEVYDTINNSWSYGKPMNKLKGLIGGCSFAASI